ncbi:MAG: transposase [Verrucomicrobiales bacterium]|nr:transposase [Verrucomicrobiales bacterium]
MPKNHHRDVRETIRAKRQWHTAPDAEAGERGFRGWHSRGYLPHFDMPGLVQFINYRLHDAMPLSRRHEWVALLEIDDELKRRTRIEDYLDRGLGACLLRDPRSAAVVEENWLHLDGREYRLLAWVVMPNHVHLLAEIWQRPQARLIKDWKGFTACRINQALRRRGQLWQDDYWDRYIRDEAHYRRVVHYIEANPVKAGLVKAPELWSFSSARFRDDHNRLRIPARWERGPPSPRVSYSLG